MARAPLPAAYVLPLRWEEDGPLDELAAYLDGLAKAVAEVIVVDGSRPDRFERHARSLPASARHLSPHRGLDFAMGKVNGVVTGLREASHDRVVIADDDVRYDEASLRRAVALLDGADLVRPQNHFDELPWHARLDTARTLLNRVLTGDPDFPVGDFPGTLALRRDALPADLAYDGDCLFENLELMRTVLAAGGSVLTPLDLYVARRPPTAAHFLSQRVRQAYDDFAIPARIGAFLAAGPAALALASRGRWRGLAAMALGSMALAEAGRRRAGGAARFPLSGSILAPAWVAERSLCSWLALGARLRGGVRYGDRRLPRSANSVAALRRRDGATAPSAGGTELPLSASKPAAL
jgi:hypothetical protein